MYYVYFLINPKTSTPFYVGKGKGSRKTDHFRDARMGKCSNKHLERSIRLLWDEGYEIPIEIKFETDNEEAAFEAERKFILEHGRRDLATGDLVNLTGGGEGITATSEETKKRNAKNAAATRAKWSEEKKAKIGQNISDTLKTFWKNLNEEEIKERTKHLRGREKKQPIAKPKKDRSAAVAKVWSSMTKEERIERTKKLRDGQSIESRKKAGEAKKKHMKNETLEQKMKRIENHKKAAEGIDWKSINKRNAASRAAWTQEQKNSYSEKMKAAAMKRWSNRKSEK